MMKLPNIYEEFGKTENKQHKFYVGSQIKRHFSFHVFASYSTINMIKEKIAPGDRKYLIDGTFRIVPRNLAQLLIISVQYGTNVSIFRKIEQ